jgi:hypothetical protein
MSVISNRHNVFTFVAGKSDALTGQRVCKAGFKQTDKMTKAGVKALTPIYASIPELDILSAEVLAEFEPHVRGLIADTQDKILSSMYVAGKIKVGDSISDEDIGIDSVLEFLNATGEKITEERIAAWYAADGMAEIVQVYTMERLATVGKINADQEFTDLEVKMQNIITATVGKYSQVFASLAGKFTKLSEVEGKLVLELLGLLEPVDTIGKRLTTKVTKMMQPKVVIADADALDLTTMAE